MRFLAFLLCLAGPAWSQVPVVGGEHDGFTRIVLENAAIQPWDSARVGDRITVTLAPDTVLDTGAIFARIGHSRIDSASATDATLTIDLACSCTEKIYAVDGHIVVDVLDSPQTNFPTVFEKTHTGHVAMATDFLAVDPILRGVSEGILTPSLEATGLAAQGGVGMKLIDPFRNANVSPDGLERCFAQEELVSWSWSETIASLSHLLNDQGIIDTQNAADLVREYLALGLLTEARMASVWLDPSSNILRDQVILATGQAPHLNWTLQVGCPQGAVWTALALNRFPDGVAPVALGLRALPDGLRDKLAQRLVKIAMTEQDFNAAEKLLAELPPDTLVPERLSLATRLGRDWERDVLTELLSKLPVQTVDEAMLRLALTRQIPRPDIATSARALLFFDQDDALHRALIDYYFALENPETAVQIASTCACAEAVANQITEAAKVLDDHRFLSLYLAVGKMPDPPQIVRSRLERMGYSDS